MRKWRLWVREEDGGGPSELENDVEGRMNSYLVVCWLCGGKGDRVESNVEDRWKCHLVFWRHRSGAGLRQIMTSALDMVN